MATFESKIDEIHRQFAAENRLTVLSEEQIDQIDQAINEEMREFRIEFSRKQEQSYADTAKIILSA